MGAPQAARAGERGCQRDWRGYAVALSKVQSVDQQMRLECGVDFRQLRTCRRIRPRQLCADFRPNWHMCRIRMTIER